MKRPSGGAAVVMLLVLFVAILPLVYVLSIGPVIWLYSSGAIGPSGTRVLEVVYFPLEWTASNVPVVGPLIVRYADLWHQPTAAVPLPPPTPYPPPVPSPTPAPPAA